MSIVNLGNGTCVKTSDKAILVELDNDPGSQHWIPQSQVDEDSEVYDRGHEGDVIVTTWWAKKNGFGDE